MITVGIVSPGAMGSAVGRAYAAGGCRTVATAAGRSPRTARLAQAAGLELLPDLDAVVAEAFVVLSIVPRAEQVAALAARDLDVRVVDTVLDDLGDLAPTARAVALGASKAWRYVDEMHEIASTQGEAGVPAELFEAMAVVFAVLAERHRAADPEDVPADLGWAALLDRLA